MAFAWTAESHIVIEGPKPPKIPTRHARIAAGWAMALTLAYVIAGAVSLVNAIIAKYGTPHHL